MLRQVLMQLSDLFIHANTRNHLYKQKTGNVQKKYTELEKCIV